MRVLTLDVGLSTIIVTVPFDGSKRSIHRTGHVGITAVTLVVSGACIIERLDLVARLGKVVSTTALITI